MDQEHEQHERMRSPLQAMIDLTAQTDVLDRGAPQQQHEQGARDGEVGRENSDPQSVELIDLTGDATAAPGQVPSRDPRYEQQIYALEHALGQANEALAAFRGLSRRVLDEQEAALTCPISYDLFETPVVTQCCGKTFSSEALSAVLRSNPRCPVCRAPRVRTHASRDVADLVELHRKERSLLVEAEAKMEQDATESTRGASGSSGLCQRVHRERRNQRVQARSAASRPRSSRSDDDAEPAVPPPANPQGDWQDQYLWLILGQHN
ncbi:hypothetical protein PHYPSEUDO_005067 [Phytophthora pseudosyringae]|uniref:SP-RING-type domain-containing protein n=1 Tax=Phytophthora pseudosyringae TaxID=221518 RepID=A0A8T1VQ23_9STRA|nr:hypothetical protein PHYPSEUDO_005067 [Phytophthora pseudosyringae]